ncbi:hypothetical protein BIW11_03894, partial [Tropilaelaps mercedesae]
ANRRHLNQPRPSIPASQPRYECPPSPALSSSSDDLSSCSEASNSTGTSSSSGCSPDAGGDADGGEAGKDDDEDSGHPSSEEDEGVEAGTETEGEVEGDDATGKGELSKLRRWGLSPPIWSHEAPWSELHSLAELEVTLQQLQEVLTEHLKGDNYNTLGNLLHFYDEFRASNRRLADFYRSYSAPVVSQGLSCVGLSLRLRDAITARLPALRRSVVMASCEEWVEDLDEYVAQPDPGVDTVKEHVMLAVRILCRATGQRVLVLIDSGYNVPRLIVVTSDGGWPHTGRFVQSDTAKSRKEYEFSWKNDGYVHWRISETRKGHMSTWSNLIYTRGSFESSLGYSEKRNLLYDFRTVVARDERGPCAGVYVKFNEPNWSAHFTLFYKDEHGERTESKFPVSSVTRGQMALTGVAEVAARLNMTEDKLLILLEDTARMYEDRSFIRELLHLNYAVDPFEQARPLVD